MKRPWSEIINRRCVSAVLYIILGVILIVLRHKAPEYLCAVIGATFAFIGLYGLVYHILKDELLIGLPLDLILLAVGAVFVFCASFAALLLTVLLGVFMIIKAIFGMQSALIAKKVGNKAWLMDLIYGAAIFVMGLLLVINPLQGSDYMSIALGVVFIVDGIFSVVTNTITIAVDSDHVVHDRDFTVKAETIESHDRDD